MTPGGAPCVNEFFASGAPVDIALAVVAVEIVALLLWRRRGGPGLRPLDLLGQLLAGAMLMLALRCALTGADYRWTAAFFGASFPAHLFDLARRARRPSGS
ncbi:MAG: hypothetical protein MUF34_29015 [Polyangiaceae bacterium]|nr:hypothetical protein [Polyangiaceae bacterium]